LAFTYNIDYTNVISPEDELNFEPSVTALVPMVVTNAALYRLKPDVSDLQAIRKAAGPTTVADLVDWTWCYHDVPASLGDQNHRAVRRHARRLPELVYRFPKVEDRLYDFVDRPNWIVVANISALPKVLGSLTEAFTSLGQAHSSSQEATVAAWAQPPSSQKMKRTRSAIATGVGPSSLVSMLGRHR
jgi:hypothetical protein